MAKKSMAVIVSVCEHCQQLIEIANDESSKDGFWEAPKVGGQIGADIITKVKGVIIKNSFHKASALLLHCFISRNIFPGLSSPWEFLGYPWGISAELTHGIRNAE